MVFFGYSLAWLLSDSDLILVYYCIHSFAIIVCLILFVQGFCPNLRFTTSRDKVSWMNICWIQTRSDYQHTLNETFDEALFQEVKVQAGTRKKGRSSMLPSLLPQCYQARLPVSAAKKADLVRLCKKQIIPEDCHKYNNNLTTTRTEKDATPAPAFGEKEADTDAE